MMRKIIFAVAAILVILVMGFFIFGGIEAENPPDAAAAESSTNVSFLETREHDGVIYEGRSSGALTTVLLIGYDHRDQGELIDTQEGFIHGGQSDFLLLLAIDHENKLVRQLQIDRDTMTDIKFYSKKGAYYGTRKLQICLSHAYGDTQELNNRNAIWAVENLLGIAGERDGAKIDWYVSMDITGIDRLNDLLGGVTVPINDDFSYYDPTMVQGTTMTLNGAQAQIYCRQRYHIGDQSNKGRMARQRVYMNAATEKLRIRLAEDKSFANELLNGMGIVFDKTKMLDESFGFTTTDHSGTPVTDTPTHYLMTDQSLDGIVATLMRAMSYEVCEPETLAGEHRLGTSGHIEFIAEKEAGLKWALDALYRPVNENTIGENESNAF